MAATEHWFRTPRPAASPLDRKDKLIRSIQQTPRDHVGLDFGGALENIEDAGVA
jgi:hypothetical protein